MLFKKTLGLLCVFLCLQWKVIGQSVVPLSTTNNNHYTFGIKQHGSELLRSTNIVVKQLALQLTKSPEETQYSIDYSYRLLSDTLKNESWHLGFNLYINKISGETSVNGFDISNTLIPNLVSFDIRLIDNDGHAIDSSSFENVIPGKDTVLIFSHTANLATIAHPVSIGLSRIVFGYDKAGLEQITQLFRAVKKYEAASMLAEVATNEADYLNRQAINPSPEMLIQIYKLSETVRLLTQLQNQWHVLIGIADPDILLTRQRILAYRVYFIKQLFLRNAAANADIHLRSNIYKLSQNWVSWQVLRFTDQEMPEFSRLVFYQSGKVSYRPDDLVFLRNAIFSILKSTGASIKPAGCLWALSDAITKTYIREGEKLSSSGHYTEAADLLQTDGRMCDAIPFATCPDRLYQHQSVALYGTYHSYINIARKALARNSPDLAIKYVDAAADFQRINSRFIITDLEVKKLKAEFADIRRSGENARLKSGDINTAKTDLPRAELAEKSANTIPITSSDNIITDGAQFQDALFEIQRLLDEVEKVLTGGDCERAFYLLDSVKQVAIEYGLSGEDPLIEIAGNYWNEADSCICKKNQAECNRLLNKAGLFSVNHDFIAASGICTKALEIIRNNASCNLNPATFEALHDLYKWPVFYQQMLSRVDSLLISEDAMLAVELYSKAGSLFSLHKLAEQGLDYLPLAEFAGTRHNYELYANAINYLLNRGRIEESLNLLSRMKADKFTPEQCKDSQERVGEKAAMRDKREKNPVQVHQRLIAYTGGSDWYNYFKKTYLKVIHL